MSARLVASLSLVVLAVGCGKPPAPPPKAPDPKPTATSTKKEKAPEMDADIGALDAKEVNDAFKRLMSQVERCQDDRRKADKLEFLSGEVALEVKVAKDGRAVESRFTTTTLGDRATEKCILAAVRAAEWPRPQGGRHGIAKSSFQLPMKGDRDAVAWESSKVSHEVARAKNALAGCAKGQRGHVTLYVDTTGKVLAAGASGLDDGATDCVVSEVSKLKFASPGGWPAKVTFALE